MRPVEYFWLQGDRSVLGSGECSFRLAGWSGQSQTPDQGCIPSAISHCWTAREFRVVDQLETLECCPVLHPGSIFICLPIPPWHAVTVEISHDYVHWLREEICWSEEEERHIWWLEVTVQPIISTVRISTPFIFVDAMETISTSLEPTNIMLPCLSCEISMAVFIPAITSRLIVLPGESPACARHHTWLFCSIHSWCRPSPR